MNSDEALDELLARGRGEALDTRSQGEFFERLVAVFLNEDAVFGAEYEGVKSYSEWAEEAGWDRRTDVGIDLVGRLRSGEGLVAVQCKFHGDTNKIRKEDIDSFMSASGKSEYVRRIVAETTGREWSRNAEEMLTNQRIVVTRIGLKELRESSIDWEKYLHDGSVEQKKTKELRDHQREALKAVREGLEVSDRGKMVMACGTGKTLTSLRIAEDMVGEGGMVLYMVPSLALMSQTVREWANESKVGLGLVSVCSDVQVGRHGRDNLEVDKTDLLIPATTKPGILAEGLEERWGDRMVVVFATYQSIDVVSEAQKRYGLGEFDLIVCDEAHRTTGVTFGDEDESSFVRVHKDENIRAKKRLYMTATPRIYGEKARKRAGEVDATLASMDDEETYGKLLYFIGFAKAVEEGLLSDYKVLILVVSEGSVSNAVVKRFEDNEDLNLDDATKILGCYKALTKKDVVRENKEGEEEEGVLDDGKPMKRVVAFCRSIATSKLIKAEFQNVVNEYARSVGAVGEEEEPLRCELDHVDGTFNAKSRAKCLEWLGGSAENECRILSNAKCLTEGVDVPSLDAVIFMNPRKSQIEVVQAVGRVMRRAPGKKMGYVILPVAILPDEDESTVLGRNDSKYKVVWQVLNALRSHDERLDAKINQIELGEDVSDKIEFLGLDETQLKAVTSKVDTLPDHNKKRENEIGEEEREPIGEQLALKLPMNEIRTKLVKKLGTLEYWDTWAKDIADVAKKIILRLKGTLERDEEAKKSFESFHEELQDDLNKSVTQEDAIELLAQHMITGPVFEALFEGDEFVRENPVSKAMAKILEIMQEKNMESETKSLDRFYASVKRQVKGIVTLEGKQALIVTLYDKFFKTAFPRVQERLGIVYTPVEVVDFIIKSVDELLQSEFGKTLGSKGVHIIDPFVGTGTFITRLMQSGLIKPKELERKYKQEIHANEIVLLAYYMAGINIETVYHGIMKEKGLEKSYTPFEGICLTDTFEMYESDDLKSHWMPENSERRKRQKALDIEVIIGNPPYSAGQRNQNDDNANVTYPDLDDKIGVTYVARSKAHLRNKLYDSYIRAIRWGSDRLENTSGGIIAYISNSAWLERSFADGMRQCLAEDFSSIYVFHLRGDVRKDILGSGMFGEGENIFGNMSMTGTSITFFVKNPHAKEQGKIFFHNIGDNLKKEEKLSTIKALASVAGIAKTEHWQTIIPDNHNDWLDRRDPAFEGFIKMGDKRDKTSSHLFNNYSLGVATNRDSWCYNASSQKVTDNMERMIATYNQERERYHTTPSDQRPAKIQDFVHRNPFLISWSRALYKDAQEGMEMFFAQNTNKVSLYRPFQKKWLYYSRTLNEVVSQMPRIFPIGTFLPNRVITVAGVGSQRGFSCLMTDSLTCLDVVEKGQNFPLYLYDIGDTDIFNEEKGYRKKDGMSDEGLRHFQEAYPGETITKEDVFYYIYGLLHSEEYRKRFANNLVKELPHIPCVKKKEDFWSFVKAGRDLADIHLNYEEATPYDVTIKQGDLRLMNIDDPVSFYRVEKMKWGLKGRGSEKEADRSTIIYNSNLTLQDIPLEAYNYEVNGKSAIKWVMDQQRVKEDKDSGITNDANDYANETMNDPAYPFDLLRRIITVSLKTTTIIKTLPPLDIDDNPKETTS